MRSPRTVAALALAAVAAACNPRLPHLAGGGSFSPLPPAPASEDPLADDPRLAEYGQFLFFATELSFDRRSSCATCHRPADAFASRHPVDTQTFGPRDVPSLRGAARRSSWMLSGDVDSLAAACVHAVGNGDMFGGTASTSVRQLSQSEAAVARHVELFGAPPSAADRAAVESTLAELGRALAAYVQRLDYGDSRFDRAAATPREPLLAADALRGFELFKYRAGCSRCHGGPNFTDDRLRDLGLPPSPIQVGLDPDDPLAKLEAGSRDANITLVRTPSLRDVAPRGPHMHDGRFATLTDVVRFYSETAGNTPEARRLGLTLKPLELSEREIADLVAFLGTLTSAPVEPALAREAP